MSKQNETKFASPERSDGKEILRARESILRQKFFIEALNTFPELVMILNANREVVYCNDSAPGLLGISAKAILRKRPGEVLGCIHSGDEPFGCGTAESCRWCASTKAILIAQKGKRTCQDCTMTIKKGGQEQALDLRVWTVPIEIKGRPYVVYTLRDIADEKRREVLERTFFHDVLNDATLLLLHVGNIIDGIESFSPDMIKKVYNIAKILSENIQEQRNLLAAERGELALCKEEFIIFDFLKDLTTLYAGSKLATNRNIILDVQSREEKINTDKFLLNRTIGNLIKNALEATKEYNIVTVGHRKEGGKHIFFVHNLEVMPESVQRCLFQRSFTTKGKGRGIGTYSVKFITENYLNGRVYFLSCEGKGTTFFVEL